MSEDLGRHCVLEPVQDEGVALAVADVAGVVTDGNVTLQTSEDDVS